ncbi:unnamed protein product [Dicrocoelium dendriticum]|nr:unnamed protein product [Dicrocoelium dendriticum]
MYPDYQSAVFVILLTIVWMPPILAVRGCVTYVVGVDYSMKQSICDKPDTHFKAVPSALPSQVVKLTINHQEITRLNASQFKHLPNLTYLDMDSNKLTVIHPDTFHQLRFLRTLSLRFNLLTLSVESFHPAAMHGLTNLEHLNLLHNPLGYIPNDIFASLGTTLKTLVLAGSSGNFQLDSNSLNGLHVLQSLDLSSNRLETLPESFEHSLNSMQLKELYLYDNPWRCDCQLRWLKLWFLKHDPKLVFSRTIPEDISRRVVELSPHSWTSHPSDGSEESITLLQPKCASPYSLYGRSLFDQPDNLDSQSLRSTDFHCTPKALTPSQSLRFARGSNATITCEFFADPSATVVWYGNGTKIQNRLPRLFVEQSQGRRFHTKLVIKEIQSSDAGIYVCFLDTGYGRANSTFFVQITTEDYSIATYMSNSLFQWFSGLDTKAVLKYTGISVSCLVVLLMLIGLFAYCVYGNRFCSRRKNSASANISRAHNTPGVDDNTGKIKSTDCAQETFVHHVVKKHANVPRVPRSTLVRKTSLKDNQELVPTVNRLTEMHLLPTCKNSDTKYVAFHLVSNGTNSSVKQECAIHNYAVIRSVAPEGLILQDEMASTGLPVGCQTSDISEVHSLFPTLQNQCDSSLRMVSSQIADADIHRIVSEFQSQELLRKPDSRQIGRKEGSYSPCPLHGDMYATLQNTEQKAINTQTNKLITTVPTGLQSSFQKRTQTLPNRSKIKARASDLSSEQSTKKTSYTFVTASELSTTTLQLNGHAAD